MQGPDRKASARPVDWRGGVPRYLPSLLSRGLAARQARGWPVVDWQAFLAFEWHSNGYGAMGRQRVCQSSPAVRWE